MTSYLVSWTIDIEADSHEEAAIEAMKIQRDPNSEAGFFEVTEQATRQVKPVDLTDKSGA